MAKSSGKDTKTDSDTAQLIPKAHDSKSAKPGDKKSSTNAHAAADSADKRYAAHFAITTIALATCLVIHFVALVNWADGAPWSDIYYKWSWILGSSGAMLFILTATAAGVFFCRPRKDETVTSISLDTIILVGLSTLGSSISFAMILLLVDLFDNEHPKEVNIHNVRDKLSAMRDTMIFTMAWSYVCICIALSTLKNIILANRKQ